MLKDRALMQLQVHGHKLCYRRERHAGNLQSYAQQSCSDNLLQL